MAGHKKASRHKSFGKSKLGSGGRFAKCVQTMKQRGNVKDPNAVCASIGKKKYGVKKMAGWAAKGHKKH